MCHNFIFFCHRSDWLLKFLYRTLSMSSDVAGLQPIDVQDRRMYNIDLSDIVSGEWKSKLGYLYLSSMFLINLNLCRLNFCINFYWSKVTVSILRRLMLYLKLLESELGMMSNSLSQNLKNLHLIFQGLNKGRYWCLCILHFLIVANCLVLTVVLFPA